MKTLKLSKIVTVLDEVHIPYMVKYNKLADELETDSEIIVAYAQGMKVAKERQLAKLGFAFKSAIWTPDPENDPIYAEVKSVWFRGAI